MKLTLTTTQLRTILAALHHLSALEHTNSLLATHKRDINSATKHAAKYLAVALVLESKPVKVTKKTVKQSKQTNLEGTNLAFPV